MTGRHQGLGAGLLAVVVGLSGACRSDDGGGSTSISTTAPSTAATTTSTTVTTGVIGPTVSTAARVVTVVVSAGQVEGGLRREQVRQGEPVTLRIVSDTADEVRVEGYDVSEDISAGSTTRLTFTPDKRGVFSVELVEDRLRILELEVI